MAGPLTIQAPLRDGYDRILSPAALAFVAGLAARFRPAVEELLRARAERQARFDAGESPDFLPDTAHIREADWRVAPVPDDLRDRRVEITGPVDRKMVINALNSGANVFMADFEDSNAPSWDNLIDGQQNLFDAVRRSITYQHPKKGLYALKETTATLMVRPRGWHLPEAHVLLDNRPIPASLFDCGLFAFHNAAELVARGTGPYFYLPKLEHHSEAILWNAVFVHAQEALGLPVGTMKATVLVETLPAVFQIDEILHALRDHSAGLNCGRWDYIFSYIKTFRCHPDRVLPDRGEVGMTQPFMRAYTQFVVKTCHRREVHAMGGMAAQIPIKADPEANEVALAKVRADKLREVSDGHDGTWVAHPGLVAEAKSVFDEHMPGANQVERKRDDVTVSAQVLTEVPRGSRTLAGLRHNIRVGVQYLAAWLGGSGCVPLYDLMEDAATAEISRTQLWQWLRHGALLSDGTAVDRELFATALEGELASLRRAMGAERYAAEHYPQAAALFEGLCTSDVCAEFLTLPAYELLRQNQGTA